VNGIFPLSSDRPSPLTVPHFPLADPVPRADGTALGGPLGTPSDGAALGPMEGVRETAGDWPKALTPGGKGGGGGGPVIGKF